MLKYYDSLVLILNPAISQHSRAVLSLGDVWLIPNAVDGAARFFGSIGSPSLPLTSTSATAAMANMNNSPITQVSQVPTHSNLQPQLLTRLFLDLRGRRFEVDRETIMNLPESVLLCLFPNGLVLSRQSVALSDGGGDEDEEEVYGVDVCEPSLVLWCHV